VIDFTLGGEVHGQTVGRTESKAKEKEKEKEKGKALCRGADATGAGRRTGPAASCGHSTGVAELDFAAAPLPLLTPDLAVVFAGVLLVFSLLVGGFCT
jgi:hypothetical protein